MNSVELLDVHRASKFITHTLNYDLQVQVNRRSALGLLSGAISRRGDIDVIEFPADKFDKMMTFLSQNDQQVHYASAQQTVGVYAIVKLVADLRRTLRDYDSAGYEPDIGEGPSMMTPRNHREVVAPSGPVPPIDLSSLGRGRGTQPRGKEVGPLGSKPSTQEGEH